MLGEMKIIDQTNNWILYSDGELYVLDVRCNYGIVEETATFLLLEEEIDNYKKIGRKIIDELSESACTSHGKAFFEKNRPISNEVKLAIKSADEYMYKHDPGFEWLRKHNS